MQHALSVYVRTSPQPARKLPHMLMHSQLPPLLLNTVMLLLHVRVW